MRLGWRKAQLGEICTFNYGKALPESARKGGSTPVFGSNGVVGHHDVPITSGRTIVIGRKGSFGEVNYSEVPSWPIDTAYFVDEASTEQDIRWLFHRLGALGLNQMNKAAAVPGLNREDAYRKEVLLPSLPEQRRIAAILDKADALRAKRREALAQLDRLAQSIFVEMFGDQRPSGIASGGITLGELVSVNPSITPVERRSLINTEVAFLPMAAVSDTDRRVIEYELRPYAEVAKGYTPFKRGDLLVAKITPCYENGKMAMASTLPTEHGFGSTEFHVFRCASTDLCLFTFYLLSQAWVAQAGAKSMKGAAGQRRVPADFFCSLKVIKPRPQVLEIFASRVSKIESLKKTARQSLLESDELFSSLQERAFKGKL